jgi:hypothetical protein
VPAKESLPFRLTHFILHFITAITLEEERQLWLLSATSSTFLSLPPP